MPQFRKVERAKTIIQDGVELYLIDCAECEKAFYGVKGQSKCDACASGKRKEKSKKNENLDLPFR